MKTLLLNENQIFSFFFQNVNMRNVAFNKQKILKIQVNMCFHILKPFLLNSLAELINWIKLKSIKFVPLKFWFYYVLKITCHRIKE